MTPSANRGLAAQIIAFSLGANLGRAFPVTARHLYVVSTPKKIRVKLNGGGWCDCATGTGLSVAEGSFFDGIEVENHNAEEIQIEIYAGFAEFKDSRQMTAQVDPNFASPAKIDGSGEIIASGAPEMLLAADGDRGEVWLWTDSPANLAWWAESAARLAAPQDFQKIGMNLEGFTKLSTKAAIWVYALAGVKIGAIVFKS